MSDVLNEIARELLCPLSKTLAIDPVLCQDGYVYEREALEGLRRNSKDPYCVPFTCQSPFHSKLKCIVEKLVSTGEIMMNILVAGQITDREAAKVLQFLKRIGREPRQVILRA